MSTLTKVTAKTAAEICQRFPLQEPAKALLQPAMTPPQFFDALVAKQHFIDAARFLANALPKREAVWWACQVARSVAGATPPPPIAAALAATEKWVADPSEDNRRAAMASGETAELGTPAGCAAAAAFWSGGSLAPPNVPVVPPPDHLTGHGVAGAVMLAAVLTEPAKAPEKYKKYFELGIAVGNGLNRWKEAPPVKK